MKHHCIDEVAVFKLEQTGKRIKVVKTLSSYALSKRLLKRYTEAHILFLLILFFISFCVISILDILRLINSIHVTLRPVSQSQSGISIALSSYNMQV